MNSKIYRCGLCGNPVCSNGGFLSDDKHKRVVNIIETYGDSHTEQVYGDCCPPEDYPEYRTVTRDMAIDAGDPSLEGTQIKW